MSRAAKPVNLALQGGGAHGAFTWGVLDRILEDGRLKIAGVSGTSAGAMNAVALADGYTRDGPDGARAALDHFWRAMSHGAKLSPLRPMPYDKLTGNWGLQNNPIYHAMNALSRVASPYQLNPMNINPLIELLEESIDFEMVRHCTAFKVFISATNVETGKVKVFPREALTAEMVMASACLPTLYQAVEIDGVPYWDGGYMGNPALFPFYASEVGAHDIIIVQINPVERPGTPKTAQGIMERLREITFNSSLLKELRSVDFINRLLDEGKMTEDGFSRMRVHIIQAPEEVTDLGQSSRMNPQWEFLEHLFDLGRDSADKWLDAHFDDVGVRQTVDIRGLFGELGAAHLG